MIDIDRAIGVSVGLGVTLLSFSGLMCINNVEETPKCTNDTTKYINKKCSKVNMNLGLGSMCVAGGLMVYKQTF